MRRAVILLSTLVIVVFAAACASSVNPYLGTWKQLHRQGSWAVIAEAKDGYLMTVRIGKSSMRIPLRSEGGVLVGSIPAAHGRGPVAVEYHDITGRLTLRYGRAGAASFGWVKASTTAPPG